jgi:glyoxylase-like metal-dependent hydrolase (beta-lactamase superfamily II)
VPRVAHAAREVIINIEPLGLGIHFITTEAVNWTIRSDRDTLTQVDAGHPGNFHDVVASIREIGDNPRGLQAILVTHRNWDHIGSDFPTPAGRSHSGSHPNIQAAGTRW